MGEKLYSELDISEHGIMLSSLPKHIAAEELEGLLRTVFVELLENENIDQSQIVQIRVLSDLYKCQKWLKNLRKFQGMYDATNEMNQRNESKGEERVKIYKRERICGPRVEKDALQFYNEKIQELKQKIREEEKEQKLKNAGMGVIIFRSR